MAVTLGKNIVMEKFNPFHIVTLSCFIEFLKREGYLVSLRVINDDLDEFVRNDLNLRSYWIGERPVYIESPNPSRHNLWRVVKDRMDEYEMSIHRYFSSMFPDIDFFMLKACLSELYFNIFDHAEANGIAFSYIHYDDNQKIIHIAICDFGKGIARTIRDAYSDVKDDKSALEKSLEKGVSSRSNEHNAGFGLDNVASALSDESTMRIASNKAVLVCRKNGNTLEKKGYSLDFDIHGTLIYFDMPISSFELTEISEEFTF